MRKQKQVFVLFMLTIMSIITSGYSLEPDANEGSDCGENYKECLSDSVDIYEETSDAKELEWNKTGCDYDYYFCLSFE